MVVIDIEDVETDFLIWHTNTQDVERYVSAIRPRTGVERNLALEKRTGSEMSCIAHSYEAFRLRGQAADLHIVTMLCFSTTSLLI